MMQDNTYVEYKGGLCHYVGVHVKQLIDGTIILSQPNLIESIFTDLCLQSGAKLAYMPMLCSVILYADLDGEPFDYHFDYQSVV